MKKIAFIIQASNNEPARALHGLLYAQELHEAGHEVTVIFDGAGTTWVKEFEDPSNRFNPIYKAVKKLGIIAGACEYCAGVYGVADEVKEAGPTLGERNGHPSIAQLVADDFQLIVL